MRPHNYDGDAGEAKGFTVARGSKIAHTVSIETIEYGPAGCGARRPRLATWPCGRADAATSKS